MNSKTPRIFLIGNMGYVGPVVASHLRKVFPYATLCGFDAGFFAGCLMDRHDFPEHLLDRQYFGDIREFSADTLDGFDAVIALAAISNDPMGLKFEKPTAEINCDAIVAIAKQAKKSGVRSFVFASSCSVYGEGGSDYKTETAEINPLTAYARSKAAAEKGLTELASPEFLVTCFRFATACGWSPRLRLDLVLNDFVASALTTGRIQILSDGSPWRPLIHVRDMAHAIEWGVIRRRENGGDCVIVNTGSNEWNFTIRELGQTVANELDGIDVAVNEKASPDKRSYRVDFSRFADLAPEHQPTMTLAATVKELVSGLRACDFDDVDFRHSALIRLNVLSELVKRGLIDGDLFHLA